MPAFLYAGRPLLGLRAAKKHLSLFPFSPAVLEAVRDRLEGFRSIISQSRRRPINKPQWRAFRKMTLELINPEELPTHASYTQVIAATGSRQVFVAGQVAEDAQGNLVGAGDLAAQARQAFANVGRALAAAQAQPEQVTRITIYVVHHRPEYLPEISEARIALFADHRPTDALLGVETLAEPEYLIEVDAIAVVD